MAEPIPLSETEHKAWELDVLVLETKAWVPYQGPQGGKGWQDTSTGDVIYDDEPPGEVIGEELQDADDESILEAVEEVFDQESRESLEEADLGSEELRAAMQELTDPGQLEEVAEAVGPGGELSDDGTHERWTRDEATVDDLQEDDIIEVDGEQFRVYGASKSGDEVNVKGTTGGGMAYETFEAGETVPVPDDIDWEASTPSEILNAIEKVVGDREGREAVEFVYDHPPAGMYISRRDEPGEDVDTLEEAAGELAANGKEVPVQFQEDYFDGHGGDVPEDLDPATADTLEVFEGTGETEGISAGSMVIAEGVGADDEKLYVTNTSTSRAPGLDAAGEHGDGYRAMLGEAALNAVDVPVPEHSHVPGEFYATKEFEGTPVSDYTGNDVTVEQFEDFMAKTLLAGVIDPHPDNVFVTPDGELGIVDIDLAGCGTHKDVEGADAFMGDASEAENPMGLEQSFAVGKALQTYRRLGPADGKTPHDAMMGVQERMEEMVESGEADALHEATEDVDTGYVFSGIRGNISAVEDGFFDEEHMEELK